MIIAITIIICVFIVFFIPWYVKQLGKFFCAGILKYMNMQIIKLQTQNQEINDGKKE